MAEVYVHPGATASGVPMVEAESTTPEQGHCVKRDDASMSLWAALARGKMSPLTYMLAGLMLAGGGGVGTSWLFGPGGFVDDAAMRNELSKLTNDAAFEREAATAERAAAALERDAAAKDRAALAKRVDDLTSAVASCEDTIDSVDGGQQELQEWIGDAMIVHNRALDDIADKIGVRVDLRLRSMATRSKGRHR